MFYNLVLLVILFGALSVNANPQQGRTLVKATTAKKMILFEEVSFIGQCFNEQSRTYYAKARGKVDFISVKQGDFIHEGEIILAIDKELLAANVVKAESALKAAEAIYNRAKSLFDKKVISIEALEKAQSMRDRCKFEFLSVSQTYKEMVITAPFSGKIEVMKLRVGDKVNENDYLFSIAAGEGVSAYVEMPESLHQKVALDTPVILRDSNGNKAAGKVVAVSSQLSNNGAIRVKVESEKEQASFVHGSYLTVAFIINKHEGLAIAEQAVLKNDKGNFVYQIDENKRIKQLYVTLGVRLNDLIEVTSKNLKEGDSLVVEGLTKIGEGSLVEVID